MPQLVEDQPADGVEAPGFLIGAERLAYGFFQLVQPQARIGFEYSGRKVYQLAFIVLVVLVLDIAYDLFE